ncbi:MULTISPECIES: type IV pilus modification PilV family protein [Psychrobacter]|jgi:type IV pilus assembly protein PilV|uniref:Prepilin-type N-terminal cleavage/methylation domain-containing protein n=2 Tax=Moraxellaceae TaxID=468 RepID=A0ABT9HGT0_9GAMM|nr:MULTISPECIES: prepilin-type N-terminal cleavage/methylation domain-containing protein [Psychrobacter]MDP4544966.1 prepilin-type N-terminal cleavage/methylation domain-containing protein [Psychrobacter faecalis]WLW66637.1 prepilin-type N-terminal cleavage/methylation domain-containing protein [Psychrobacter sp. van23A]HCR87555.1 type IV pilus modification protein PilV [Psychrobacter sp.]
MLMKNSNSQSGVGLIEVMVALLLLAVAVLGFSALNMVSVKATDDSVLIANANTVMRGLSEDLRLNPDNILIYQQDIQSVLGSVSDTKDYCTAVAAYKAASVTKNCDNDLCTAEELGKYNSSNAMQKACDNGVLLNMVTCPGTANKQLRHCIITSWSGTKPVFGANTDSNKACADTSGVYYAGSDCLIMESY